MPDVEVAKAARNKAEARRERVWNQTVGGGTLERPPMNEPYHARSPAQKTFREHSGRAGQFWPPGARL